MSIWAIDLGTSNTLISRWSDETDTPELLYVDGICRDILEDQEIDLHYTIPSCIYLPQKEDFWDRIAKFPFIRKHFFLGSRLAIGYEAIQKDLNQNSKFLVKSFKTYLSRKEYQSLRRIGRKSYSALEVTSMFLRELFYHIKQTSGERPRELVFSVPVDSYEHYRANLTGIAKKLGVIKVRTIDEPVAAAIGYGLNMSESKSILVIDFGGGTLDMALLQTEEKQTEVGRARVVAKQGAPVGGDLVDSWLVEEFCKLRNLEISKSSQDANNKWWYRILLEESRRVKEGLFFNPQGSFYIVPPKEMQSFHYRLMAEDGGNNKALDFNRDQLVNLLTRKGLYSLIDNMLTALMEKAREKGIKENQISDVLMVGGSTLLPGIYKQVETRFGRDRVHAWQPFNAVTYGAAAFGAGRLEKEDFITHDYAFVTYNKKTHDPEYNVIVPRESPFPTQKDFWKRHLIPTCSLGEPENMFKLVICEIGSKHLKNQEFVWDQEGGLHVLKESDADSKVIIPLNEENPVLGLLNPPHYPSEKGARLEVSFMVNEDRWLCTTVFDLKTNRYILNEKPVLRLK